MENKQIGEYEISIKGANTKQILKKYGYFLSKKDVKKIINLSLEFPEHNFESIVTNFLERKYASKNLSEILDDGGYDDKDSLQDLGLSRKRFYFLLNHLVRFVAKKRIEQIVSKGKILRLNHDRKDRKSINNLLKHKRLKKQVLLNPGPVLTSWDVKSSLIQQDICHRDTDFEILLNRLKRNSLKIFDGKSNYSTIFVSGSGTAGVECAISSVMPQKKKILIASNGAFGERIAEIADSYGIKKVHIKKKWGELVDINEIEEQLKLNKDIWAVAVTHHETSVGILNPVHNIGKLCKKYKKVFIVDAVSSLGAEKISVSKDNIDICVSSSNKCLHSVSGVALLCVNNRIWSLIKDVKPRSYYLDLKKHHAYLKKRNQTPYTPFVSSLFALDKAIRELLREGIEMRRLKYMELNSILKLELSLLGFEFFTNYDCQSHSILTVKIPKGINFKRFYNALKYKGFVIYACKKPLDKEYFQIANMGAITKSTIYDFIFVVKSTLKKMRSEH